MHRRQIAQLAKRLTDRLLAIDHHEPDQHILADVAVEAARGGILDDREIMSVDLPLAELVAVAAAHVGDVPAPHRPRRFSENLILARGHGEKEWRIFVQRADQFLGLVDEDRERIGLASLGLEQPAGSSNIVADDLGQARGQVARHADHARA